MAKQGSLYNSPTANPFAFLQQEGKPSPPDDKRAGAKKDTEPTQLTPAQKAERRNAANAEKAREAEAAKQKADAEAALAALVGPLDDFQTQKGPKKTHKDQNEKKLKREEYEASKDKPQYYERPPREGGKQFDGPKKDRPPGERKQREFREGGSGQNQFNKEKDFNKPKGANQPHGHVAPRHGRDHDKRSAAKTSNKPEDKRHGEGQANWGNPIDDVPVASGGGWGDENEPTSEAPATSDAPSGWGDENEPEAKSEPIHEEKEAAAGEDAPAPREKRDDRPAWDDEGYGKMTYQEFQAKVAAQQAAELANKVGVVKPRERDLNVDMSKFVEKKDDLEEDRYGKRTEKKEKKKATPVARPGEKPVAVTDLFDVGGRGRGGRGGDRPANRGDRGRGDRGQGRGDRGQGRGGDRQQQGSGGGGNNFSHKVPSNKAFPELSAAVKQ